MSGILKRIQEKTHGIDLVPELESLSVSDLNSIFLELFRKKTSKMSPAHVLDQFTNSRFVLPSDIDPIEIKETELKWLKIAKTYDFEPIILSPLTPIGTSSVLGHVDQNNVISALRGTEVVSDATNVLALKIAEDFKKKQDKSLVFRYSTVHRHTRGQAFDNPKFSAHFSNLCLVSGGFDHGNYAFESDQLQEHLSVIYQMLSGYIDKEHIELKIYMKSGSDTFMNKLKATGGIWMNMGYELIEDRKREYYQTVQFKLFVMKDGQEYNIADGGFVDWTQKLLGNKKHRCMISGIGIELLHRI